MVDKADIAANGYDLSINRYKEVVYEQVEYEAPSRILADLEVLEQDILKGMATLKEMLKWHYDFKIGNLLILFKGINRGGNLKKLPQDFFCLMGDALVLLIKVKNLLQVTWRLISEYLVKECSIYL